MYSVGKDLNGSLGQDPGSLYATLAFSAYSRSTLRSTRSGLFSVGNPVQEQSIGFESVMALELSVRQDIAFFGCVQAENDGLDLKAKP